MYLYILLCDNSTYYVGISNNPEKRLIEHQQGDSFFTKRFNVIKLVYTEYHSTRALALRRERQIKGWSHLKKKALIENDTATLKGYSKNNPERH